MVDPSTSQIPFDDPSVSSLIAGAGTSRRRFLGLAAMAVSGAVIGVGTSACGTAQTGRNAGSESQGRAGAAGETLFVAGFQWGPPTNFNPLAPTPAWPTAVRHPQYVYETLVRFNMLDGTLAPGLGKALEEPDKQTIVVPLQDGTKWSDGSELTAEDVAFTFGLAKTSSGLWFSPVWQYVDSIEATDPRTVTFTLKTKPYNPNLVKDYIANVMIMPKAVWEQDRQREPGQGDEPEADRQRSVHRGQGGPDPDQPGAQRQLLGEDGLRGDAGQGDEPPDLQEQQRR